MQMSSVLAFERKVQVGSQPDNPENATDISFSYPCTASISQPVVQFTDYEEDNDQLTEAPVSP